ncbi:MAG: hypothetical protein H7246_01860 [Phycisphaerae bacterium]|nr:hypothetical protein [Saprospiraceae bacterium]
MKKTIALTALWVVWLSSLPGQSIFERIAGMEDIDSIEAVAQQYFGDQRPTRDTLNSREDHKWDNEEARFNRWWYMEKTRSFPGRKLSNWRLNNFVEAVKFYNTPSAPSGRERMAAVVGPASNGDWSLFQSNHPFLFGCNVGRTSFIESLPGDPNTLFTGSPTGTLWRSTNGSASWTSLTDNLPVTGVAGLAIDPTNTSVWYLATGDPVPEMPDRVSLRRSSLGIFKTLDGGSTWIATSFNQGLGNIKKIKLHPSNNNTVLVSTTLGLFRSTDGMATNTKLPIPNNNAVIDFEFKTSNPDSILAAGRSNIFLSRDGGNTWQTLGTNVGLPTGSFTRIELAVSPANSEVFYALFTDLSGFQGLFRSDNAGAHWDKRSSTPNLMSADLLGAGPGGQVPYNVALECSPVNPDIVHVGGVYYWRSVNGGIDWIRPSLPGLHVDIQNLQYLDGALYCNSDAGIFRSMDDGSSWADLGSNLAISQYYRLGGSPQNPNLYLVGAQDVGVSRLTNTGQTCIGFGDGMECAIDYTNPNICFFSLNNGALWGTVTGNLPIPISVPIILPGDGPWVTSYIFHTTDPSIMFYGANNDVWRGKIITIITPPIPPIPPVPIPVIAWQGMSNPGPTTTDPTNDEIVQLAHSPNNINRLYVARERSIQRTDNAMASTVTWTDITPSTANVTPPISSTPRPFTYIVADPNDAAHVYVTIGGATNNQKVFESTTAGATWTNISGNLLPNVSANCIVFEPGSLHRVYLGTDLGVFYHDDNTAGQWVQFSNGLPMVPVLELEINGGFLAAATHGRGVWRTPTLATCATDLVLTPADDPGTPQSSGIQYNSASNSIESTRLVTGGVETNVNYKAGHHTLLLPGFRAFGLVSTGTFKVTTGACNAPFLFRMAAAPPKPKKVNFDGDLKVFTGQNK